MASQAIERLTIQELPLFGDTSVISVPVKASLVCRATDISPLPEVKIYHHSKNQEGSLILGLAWALGLEAAAAIGVLGIWNLLHLLR